MWNAAELYGVGRGGGQSCCLPPTVLSKDTKECANKIINEITVMNHRPARPSIGLDCLIYIRITSSSPTTNVSHTEQGIKAACQLRRHITSSLIHYGSVKCHQGQPRRCQKAGSRVKVLWYRKHYGWFFARL